MKILKNFKEMMLYAGLNKQDFDYVKTKASLNNRRSLNMFCIIMVVYLSLAMVSSIFSEVAKINFWYYFATAIYIAIIFLISKFVKCYNHHFNLLLIYLYLIGLLAFGIIIGTYTITDAKSAIFPALLLGVPLFFMDRPIKLYSLLTINVIIFCILDIVFKESKVYTADLLNVIILYLCSMALSYFIIHTKYLNLYNEKKILFISEIDVLTGLYNRNAYEKKIQEYQNDDHTCCQLIYFDVNGLHQINNTYGHEAGDLMLKTITQTIKDIFGTNSYRVGGDEFIVINIDKLDSDIENKIIKFNKEMEEYSYYVAVGFESSLVHVNDFTELCKNAEKNMYKQKEEYYHTKGLKRELR